MRFDIYKCTVYTERARLMHEFRKKHPRKKLAEDEKREFDTASRANALDLLGLKEYPCEDETAYEWLNSIFSKELMNCDKSMDIAMRTIKQANLVPILINARKKALQEFWEKPKGERRVSKEEAVAEYVADFEKWRDAKEGDKR